jgi:hypothetical protein
MFAREDAMSRLSFASSPVRICTMSSPPTLTVQSRRDDHWKFLRDVLVFQLKMLLDNVRDFALMPVSLAAALIDLIFKGERQGTLFYQVLKWGAHSEEVINVYSAIETHERPEVNPKYTIDAVIARLEGVLVRECEKGGTAASVKAAMDRAIDQIQIETSGPRDRAREAVARAAGKLRSRFENGSSDNRS